jgi:cytochrome oxidase Cu insertion factor (SCO1/SenC/PrrC family)
MLAQWLPYELALLGVLALGPWAYGRLRRRRAALSSLAEVLSFCLAAACLIASVAIVVLDRLDDARKEQSANSHGPITAADYHAIIMPLGIPAPDFTLPRLGGGVPVHLADMVRQRPVVLVFGSFGCADFCSRLDKVRELQERYGSRADFLFIYINNRHPEPESLQKVMADATAPPDAPVNRLARIRAGMGYFGVRLACVVDTDDDRVQHEYDAFPARLVIIDKKSKVAFDSGSILFSGLNPAGAAAWLEKHTTPTKSALQ